MKRLRGLTSDKRAMILAIGSDEGMIPASDVMKIFLAEIALQDAAASELERLAPLLEAAKSAENAMLDYVPRLEDQGCTMGYGRAVLRELRAAIATAEGDAS
ncbi:MAG: hypothetical protein AAF389_14730 [Gemmatimonadota bacterium]